MPILCICMFFNFCLLSLIFFSILNNACIPFHFIRLKHFINVHWMRVNESRQHHYFHQFNVLTELSIETCNLHTLSSSFSKTIYGISYNGLLPLPIIRLNEKSIIVTVIPLNSNLSCSS